MFFVKIVMHSTIIHASNSDQYNLRVLNLRAGKFIEIYIISI
jgi:hypothetical protein